MPASFLASPVVPAAAERTRKNVIVTNAMETANLHFTLHLRRAKEVIQSGKSYRNSRDLRSCRRQIAVRNWRMPSRQNRSSSSLQNRLHWCPNRERRASSRQQRRDFQRRRTVVPAPLLQPPLKRESG